MKKIFFIFLNLVFAVLQVSSESLGFRSLWDKRDNSWKGKTVYCTNSDRVLSENDMRHISANHINSIEISNDTIKISLRGGSDIHSLQKMLKPSYTCELSINESRCRYEKREIRSQKPKTAQYTISDSCFYLTFDISPEFQTKGIKTWMSFFIVTNAIPKPGTKFPIKTIIYNVDNPIKVWNTSDGDLAVVQIVHMPPCDDFFNDSIAERHKNQRIILSSDQIINGQIEISEFNPGKSELASAKIKVELSASVSGGNNKEYSSTIYINNCTIDLYQIQKSNLPPMLFEIDYGWKDSYLPL